MLILKEKFTTMKIKWIYYQISQITRIIIKIKFFLIIAKTENIIK